jgi:hypothetical protein
MTTVFCTAAPSGRSDFAHIPLRPGLARARAVDASSSATLAPRPRARARASTTPHLLERGRAIARAHSPVSSRPCQALSSSRSSSAGLAAAAQAQRRSVQLELRGELEQGAARAGRRLPCPGWLSRVRKGGGTRVGVHNVAFCLPGSSKRVTSHKTLYLVSRCAPCNSDRRLLGCSSQGFASSEPASCAGVLARRPGAFETLPEDLP